MNYDHATVWRVIKDIRIDLGAISSRYVARESPNFVDGPTRMRHDTPGVVSVRRGDGGGTVSPSILVMGTTMKMTCRRHRPHRVYVGPTRTLREYSIRFGAGRRR